MHNISKIILKQKKEDSKTIDLRIIAIVLDCLNKLLYPFVMNEMDNIDTAIWKPSKWKHRTSKNKHLLQYSSDPAK